MRPVVDRFVVGAAQENCYIVRADHRSREAVVVDPGDGASQLRLELAGIGARCAAVLLTHTHADHIGAVAELAEGTGAPVYVSELERVVLESPDAVYASRGIRIRPHGTALGLAGDETLELAGISFATLQVPGHSPGHLAFQAEECLFSGDVLFAGSVGRTDLPGSDRETLLRSIRLLMGRLEPGTVVYPGHGPPTTLGAELESNPFLRELRDEPASS